MLRLFLAALLAVIAMPAQAATYVKYEATGTGIGYYSNIYGETGEFTGTLYATATVSLDALLGFGNPRLSAGGGTIYGIDTRTGSYSEFRLNFDYDFTGLPLTADGFIGGYALGNLYRAGYNGGGWANLTSLKVTIFESDQMIPLQVPTGISMPVPEPTTWAMMIAGLGLVGAALRRHAAKASMMSCAAL